MLRAVGDSGLSSSIAQEVFGSLQGGITPYVDLGLTSVNVGALDESGAGAFDENVAAHRELFPTIASGLRYERIVRRGANAFHFTLDASVTQLLGNAQATTTAALAGAPAGVAPFTLSNAMDHTYFGLAPSLEVTHNDRFGIRLSATDNFSAGTHSLGTYVQFTTKL